MSTPSYRLLKFARTDDSAARRLGQRVQLLTGDDQKLVHDLIETFIVLRAGGGHGAPEAARALAADLIVSTAAQLEDAMASPVAAPIEEA